MSELNKDKVLEKCNAVLESAKLFYRTHWSQVKEGDTVLVSEHDHIQESLVVEIEKRDFEGRLCLSVILNPQYSRRRYKSACWPDAIVYVRSRF